MRIRQGMLALLSSAALLSACSGGGSDNGGSVVTPTPTPGTTTPTPTTPTPTPGAPTPTGNFQTDAAAMYTAGPNIDGCQQGTLAQWMRDDILARVNQVRALHRLPAVTYSSLASDETEAQAAALMMAANRQLSHTPPADWSCYSAPGASGAAASNLYLGRGEGLSLLTNEQVVAGWMAETANLAIDNVGHRRWILDPFLNSIAYGRVAGSAQSGANRADAAALRVIGNAGAAPSTANLPDFVAYPYEDYPARYYAGAELLSFGVIADRTSRAGNANVNFNSATITIQQRGGATLRPYRIVADNDGYGLPNNLQFAVDGLQQNVYYDVTIGNVIVNGAARSYSYYFRLIP